MYFTVHTLHHVNAISLLTDTVIRVSTLIAANTACNGYWMAMRRETESCSARWLWDRHGRNDNLLD